MAHIPVSFAFEIESYERHTLLNIIITISVMNRKPQSGDAIGNTPILLTNTKSATLMG